MLADPTLARLSDQFFWAGLALYGLSLALFVWSMTNRRGRIGTAATIVAALGAGAHTTSIVTRGLSVGRVPWGNMYEYSSLVALLLVAAYLIVVDGRFRMRQVGPFAMAAVVLLMGSARSLYAPAGPLVPALNTYWIKIHVIAAIAASSIFSLSFVFAVLYLFKDRAERKAAAYGGSTVGAAYVGTELSTEEGFPADHVDDDARERAVPVRGFLGRLPAAAALDRLSLWGVSIAFPIWTFAVIAGALWANKAWGRYWGWDPKETWAFITWVIYAGYLHSRATAGWRGRKAAYINIAGFVALWVTYYVVNIFIVGLHSYAK